MSRPPSGRGSAQSQAWWATAIALTIDRPRPLPLLAASGAVGCQALERTEQAGDLGGRYHRAAVRRSEGWPVRRWFRCGFVPSRRAGCSGWRCRAGSSPAARPAWSHRRSPRDRSIASTVTWRLAAWVCWAPTTSAVIAARSTGSSRSRPRWLLASVSSASISRSCCSPAASTRPQAACSAGTDGCGSASATSISGALPGQRSAQLVRGVGGELPLRGERRLKPGQQAVEGVAKFLEFVVGPGQRQPRVQAARRDRPGRAGDRAQRPQYPPGDQPAEADRRDRHDRQRDPGLDEQTVQLGALLLGQALADLGLDLSWRRRGRRRGQLAAAGTAADHIESRRCRSPRRPSPPASGRRSVAAVRGRPAGR